MSQNDLDDIERDFTRPWFGRRGIETIDRNGEVVLVKVPLDKLSDALAKRALEVRRNVMGSEIEVSGTLMFASQLIGHPWSILVFSEFIKPDRVIEPDRVATSSPSEAQLSKELEQPVILLFMSDTSGVIGYRLFEDGEITEYFGGEEGEVSKKTNEYGLKTQRYVLFPYGHEHVQTVEFWSRHRQVTAKQIGDMWDFAEQFLIDQDAFDPGIDSQYLLGSDYSLQRGRRYRVQNPGTILVLGNGCEVRSVPELVQVDYFRIGN